MSVGQRRINDKRGGKMDDDPDTSLSLSEVLDHPKEIIPIWTR